MPPVGVCLRLLLNHRVFALWESQERPQMSLGTEIVPYSCHLFIILETQQTMQLRWAFFGSVFFLIFLY